MNKLFIIIMFCLLVEVFSACPPNYDQCGNSCYDPTVYNCNLSKLSILLCPVEQSVCEGNCYDPTQLVCLPTGNVDPTTQQPISTLCPINTLLCGEDCYDPTVFECFPSENNLLCSANDLLCEGDCYNPVLLDCVPTAQVDPTTLQPIYTLCPFGDFNCGTACYDPTVFTCLDQAEGGMCSVGDQMCGTACYDPSQYSCYGGSLCASENVCNGECTNDPTNCPPVPAQCCTLTECWNGIIPCPGALECCATFPNVWNDDPYGTCYDPSVSACVLCPQYNPTHLRTGLCPIETPICCGDTGCVPTTQQCCHQDQSFESFPCPLGDTCCGLNNIPNALCCLPGTHCYDDTAGTIPYCA